MLIPNIDNGVLHKRPTCRSCGETFTGEAIVRFYREQRVADYWLKSSPLGEVRGQEISRATVGSTVYQVDSEHDDMWPEEDCCHMCIGKL